MNKIENLEDWLKKQIGLFGKAFRITWEELLVSSVFVVVVSFGLGTLFYIVEHNAQPEVFKSYKDAWLWAYSRYIESGDGVFDGSPVTAAGTWIASVLGFMGLAFVIIPTGLLASGFEEATREAEREKELDKKYKILLKSFKKNRNRNLKVYLQNIPQAQATSKWYSNIEFRTISNNYAIANYQLQSIDLKDILDICRKHPELRVCNTTKDLNVEDANKHDRFAIEYYPVNKKYGCCIDRDSKVTIVSTSSKSEPGTSNFAYSLAQFGGFNYISKEFDVDVNETDSFYNIGPSVFGKTKEEKQKSGEDTKEDQKLFEEKKRLKEEFINDLIELSQKEGAWVIFILAQAQNKENDIAIHVSHNIEDGSNDTICDGVTFQKMYQNIVSSLRNELKLKTEESQRYPLLKQNIAYKLQESNKNLNCMTLRVSSDLLLIDSNRRIAQLLLCNAIKEAIEPGKKLREQDIAYLNSPGIGFPEDEQGIHKDKKLYKDIIKMIRN